MKRRPAPLVLDGYVVHFTRRHYGGGVFYTWADVEVPGSRGADGQPTWLSLGDPWPCARPANTELRAAITRAIDRLPGGA